MIILGPWGCSYNQVEAVRKIYDAFGDEWFYFKDIREVDDSFCIGMIRVMVGSGALIKNRCRHGKDMVNKYRVSSDVRDYMMRG